MAHLSLKGVPINTCGNLPTVHSKLQDFCLVDADLKDRCLYEFRGKKKLLGTVPSLDTGVCSKMTARCNTFAKKHPDVIFLIVSADLPFAQKRFCETQHVHNVLTLSMMRDKEFGKTLGILIEDSPLAGLLARSLLVLDEQDRVLYAELVPEIAQEPDYDKAFSFLNHSP